MERIENDYDIEMYEVEDKTPVECICPKCGLKHTIYFRWIGVGTPRKYCKKCRGLITAE